MSWCDRCPKPGNCCKKLKLRFGDSGNEPTFWAETAHDDAVKFAEDRGDPFRPAEIEGRFSDPDTGREYVSFAWTCPKLGADGRCTIYDQRPQTCRDYKPGSDPLCVFTKKGTVRAAHREST